MITIEQIRAGRALLDWSQSDLADRGGLSQTGIARIENGTNQPNSKTLDKILSAFDRADIEFIDEKGVQKRVSEVRTLVGKKGLYEFFDDVYETLKSSDGEFSVFNGNAVNWFDHIGRDFFQEHKERMIKIKERLNGRIMLHQGDTSFLGQDYAQYRWFKDDEGIRDNKTLYSYGNKFAFLDFANGEVSIIILKRYEFAKGFRVLFDIAWNSAIVPAELR